ncbi:helix-turn-helix domain-containing protein [Limihaloglobus sulfuriphilus]|uniref:helix-turn-helix domain-containing protein n=1 Tax=Limihaloglobus sulfuriphilus TaxID=1851148 RepID=UPI0011BAD83D|nr:AraC family transcriptional regulator [Limihaloglobus sulfuriphilus]
MNSVDTFLFSAQMLPRIMISGIFEHPKRTSPAGYLISYHAMHYYMYSGTVEIAGSVYPFSRGDITITPANTRSVYTLNESGRHICFHFSLPAGAVSLPFHIPAARIEPDIPARLKGILEICMPARNSAGSGTLNTAIASNMLHRCLLELAQCTLRDGDIENDFNKALRVLINYIELNLDKPMSVPDLCRVAGMSQNYLARRFRAVYGSTIKEYILSRRIERACYLLRNMNISIKEIAFQCGIANPQYFNKLFRSIKHVSPSKYRCNGD